MCLECMVERTKILKDTEKQVLPELLWPSSLLIMGRHPPASSTFFCGVSPAAFQGDSGPTALGTGYIMDAISPAVSIMWQ